MPKHLLEDMVQTKHINRRSAEPKEKQEEEGIKISGAKTRSRFMLWLVALVSVVFFLFALSSLFTKAEVKVNPKIEDMVLNENLSASKDSNSSNGILSFNLMVVSGTENKNIQASGKKDVSEKATGMVVIYNIFSSSSQALSVDTRLEGSNGKIYKTQEKTIVPGMNKDGTPGSVEVKIYGAEAGPDYNSGPLDFKIFNFQGTPKYSKFYGRSKGEISGGFIGQAPDISDADRATAVNDLKTALGAELLQKAANQIPGGFILFKDATLLDTSDSNISSIYKKDNSLTLTQSGTFYGLIFNEQELTKKIAQDNIDKYDGSDVYVPNIKNLTFTLSDKDNVSLDSAQNIDFNLSGPAKIVWKLDVNKFTADLLGKSKSDFKQILSRYPGIDSASLTVSPFWKMSIPDKTKNVKVIVNYPQ
jgi:hypothetical protein